jgi:hypothetical protein
MTRTSARHTKFPAARASDFRLLLVCHWMEIVGMAGSQTPGVSVGAITWVGVALRPGAGVSVAHILK